MTLRGAQELAEFISKNYSGKIIEVGVGHRTDVASYLRSLQLVVIDIKECCLPGIEVEQDDIFSPKKEIYIGASLIYSLRPSLELQLAIGNLAREVGADIIIRPLEDEIADILGFTRRLENRGQARFYLFRQNP
ncbi:MAG: hypothetical protein MUO26_10670 [Methanotrichaceae archaeon]|nr:hypothetical protein [Methanotrichaceae archaeon]